MSQNSIDNNEDNAVHAVKPFSNGWILVAGPDDPAFDVFRQKEAKPKKRRTESVSEPSNSTTRTKVPISQAKAFPSVSNSSFELATYNNRPNILDSTRKMTPPIITSQIPPKMKNIRVVSTPVTLQAEPRPISSTKRKLPVSRSIVKETPIVPMFTVPYCLSLLSAARLRYSKQLFEQLDGDQRDAYNAVVFEKKNVFIAGAKGTGKAKVLKSILCTLLCAYELKYVALTSFTGTVARDIKGMTLNEFAFIDDAEQSLDEIISEIKADCLKMKVVNYTKVLIIDRISMIDIELFEKIDKICRRIRINDTPFGGIKVILCGDIYDVSDIQANDKLVFESEVWQTAVEKSFSLRIKSRDEDHEYYSILKEVISGKISDETKALLLQRNL